MRKEAGLHAKVIACAEQALSRLVPHGEAEVAQEVGHAVLAPRTVRAEEQLDVRDIRCACILISRAELRDEIGASIESRVADDPSPAIERERLLVAIRLAGNLQQRVGEAGVLLDVDTLRVGPAKRQ